jgi:hypothetical protein
MPWEQVLPPRPDVLEYEPPTPKRRRVWPWVLAIVVALGIGGAVNEQAKEPTSTYVPPAVEAPTSSGLVSYDGVTVDEMVSVTVGTPVWDAVCALIPTVGVARTRQIYLDAEPQLGTDAYEGAVFDAAIAGC